LYDNICKFLAKNFSTDLAQWLIGQPVSLTELQPTELSSEPIRADSLIFLQSQDIILHIEFQTSVDPDIPLRMADYFLRIYRKYPHKQIYQVVIYLKKTASELARKDNFNHLQMQHRYNLIRLWEVPTVELLSAPGLLPLAVLSQNENPTQVLEEVAKRIETVTDSTEKSNLTASTAIIAGLVLDRMTIGRLLRNEIMKESVIYQEIEAIGLAKGLQEGKQQGLQEGKQQGLQEGKQQGLQQGKQQEVNLILKQLKRRIGEIPQELVTQISDLSLQQLESLGEALLDFQTQTDLIHWFELES
jgi:predicted transposase/invertase (TIGR01784 family)